MLIILFLVALKMLLRATLHAASHVLVLTRVIDIPGVEHEEITSVAYDLRIGDRTRTAAKRKIINGVKQVGLALTVVPYETIKLLRESKLRLGDILIIQYRQFIQKHPSYSSNLMQS